jgi:hypothetical protein
MENPTHHDQKLKEPELERDMALVIFNPPKNSQYEYEEEGGLLPKWLPTIFN